MNSRWMPRAWLDACKAGTRVFARHFGLSVTFALLLAAWGASGADDAAPVPRNLHKRTVAAWHERDMALARTNATLFVRPGLIADRSARTVRVYGESIRLGLGDPVEFLLIGEASGKDYEAMAVSFALPSDVHAALQFAGLKPGAPVDASELRFWPRGERVRMSFELLTTNGLATPLGRAESTVVDTRTGAPLAETGFVFCGGRWLEPTEDSGAATGRVYASDVYSPNSIVAIYNEPGTVLDLPRRAAQSEVYTFQVPNPERRLPASALLQATFTPAFADGGGRMVDWALRVHNGTNSTPVFTATGAQGKVVLASRSADDVTAALQTETAAGHDIFAVFEPDDTTTLKNLSAACAAVERIEDRYGLRIGPPPAGHPYYKAFLPTATHRDRTQRPTQPFELLLASSAQGPTGILSLATEEWKGNDSEPVYHEQAWPVASPADLAGPLGGKDVPAVLLVFAPGSMTYAQLKPYAAEAVARRMILFVFNGNPTGTLKKPIAGKGASP